MKVETTGIAEQWDIIDQMIYKYKETGDLYSVLHFDAILCGALKNLVKDRQMVCYLQHKTGKNIR